MTNQSFQIDLISEAEGGYTVVVPQLPGCISFGNTVEEAKNNAKEAIDLHLENIQAHNKVSLKEIIQKTVFSTAIQVKHSYA